MLLRKTEQIIKNHKAHLYELGVHALSVFGSTARGEETKMSDIDILIEFDATRGIFGFLDTKSYLETILDCKVDLVTKNALHPALKKQILHEAKNVF